jgi:hypothetical protein
MTTTKSATRERHRPNRVMTAEQRVDAVVKIVGPQHRAPIARMVELLMKTAVREHSARDRQKRSQDKRLAGEVETAAHRLYKLIENKVPVEWFSWSTTDREHVLGELRKLLAVCATVRVGLKSEKPKPDALEQRLSAMTALTICRECGIEPRLTRGGKYFKIAAALYGDPKANLDHQCRWARDRHKRKTAPE